MYALLVYRCVCFHSFGLAVATWIFSIRFRLFSIAKKVRIELSTAHYTITLGCDCCCSILFLFKFLVMKNAKHKSFSKPKKKLHFACYWLLWMSLDLLTFLVLSNWFSCGAPVFFFSNAFLCYFMHFVLHPRMRFVQSENLCNGIMHKNVYEIDSTKEHTHAHKLEDVYAEGMIEMHRLTN